MPQAMSPFSPYWRSTSRAFPVGLDLVELGLEHLHREFAIAALAALGLAGHDDAGGHVGDADGGFDLVDVLAALAACAEGVELEVGFVDLDRRVFDFGDDIHTRERGMAALG